MHLSSIEMMNYNDYILLQHTQTILSHSQVSKGCLTSHADFGLSPYNLTFVVSPLG